MRILLVGNDPHDIGGVVHYTRPLALEFSKSGHKVYYFYSGAWKKKYNWILKAYLKISYKDFPFECAELVNSPNWTYNFGSPWVDMSEPQTERIFLAYIKKIRPDIIHIHSRLGLPASIIAIAAREGIRILNTIHVYGLLCQKRVMIDHEGRPCEGPSAIEKCVECTASINLNKMKWMSRIENTNKDLFRWLVALKRNLSKKNIEMIGDFRESHRLSKREKERIKYWLQRRLHYMVDLMNHRIDCNICVSMDVQRTLKRYGVKEKKLLVQHIGSKIAEYQRSNFHGLHNPPVIGNIGGVSFYKGTHILLDAVDKMRNKNFKLKIFGRYDNDYLKLIIKGKEALPIEFFGKYLPEELPRILEQIDLMVLPSICKDTAPQTIFESYSARIPIIASNIGGFPDFIKEGVNGCLFNPGDSRELAKKIDDILDHPDIIISYARNIPFLKTIKENAEELISLYQKCLSMKT